MLAIRLAGSLVLLAILLAGAQAFALPAPDTLPAALAELPGADLVFFDEPQPGQPSRVLLAARTKAPLARLRAVLVDPGAYQRAVPSFRRAEVLGRQGGNVEIEWELEVPLWNLEGKLWLRPAADGVDLQLVEGDLAPGLFQLRTREAKGGVVLSLTGQANMREANWATKRLVKRSPLAEPAMTATAAWVLLRALVLEAERPGAALDPRRRPAAGPSPPALAALDGSALARLARGRLGPGQAMAAVRPRPDGRLDRIEVAALARFPAAAVQKALGEGTRWQALPGWHKVMPRPGPPPTTLWEVDSRFPFVDFDAVWSIRPGPPLRGQVVGGDARGAVLGWDVVDGGAPQTAVAVLSLHPRLETSGYIPRKFIEAEPLLEHGLALGVAYVDAVSLLRALQGKQ
ncbi:MAG TPA: hypothetical protein VN914_10435 [Polyangia bacterium]|nr:hypothetical protein [Polyangia bacterium]